MAYRIVSNHEAKTPEDAQAVVVSETGGACIPSGEVKQVRGGFAVEVFSMDGLNEMPLSAGRSYFHVKDWNAEKGRGIVEDKQRVEYVVRAIDLAEECGGSLIVGQWISASVSHQFNLSDVLPESGPNSISPDKRPKRNDGSLSEAEIERQIRLYSNQ